MADIKEATNQLLDAISESVTETIKNAGDSFCDLVGSNDNRDELLELSIAEMKTFIDNVDKEDTILISLYYDRFKQLVKIYEDKK